MHNYLLIHGLLTLILLDGQLFKRRIGNKKENLRKRNINKTLWMSLQWFIVPRYSPVKESSVRPESSEGMTSVHLFPLFPTAQDPGAREWSYPHLR